MFGALEPCQMADLRPISSGPSRFGTDCSLRVSQFDRFETRAWSQILRFEQASLTRIVTIRRLHVQMFPARIVKHAPALGSRDQAQLDEVRFDHFLDRVALL